MFAWSFSNSIEKSWHSRMRVSGASASLTNPSMTDSAYSRLASFAMTASSISLPYLVIIDQALETWGNDGFSDGLLYGFNVVHKATILPASRSRRYVFGRLFLRVLYARYVDRDINGHFRCPFLLPAPQRGQGRNRPCRCKAKAGRLYRPFAGGYRLSGSFCRRSAFRHSACA